MCIRGNGGGCHPWHTLETLGMLVANLVHMRWCWRWFRRWRVCAGVAEYDYDDDSDGADCVAVVVVVLWLAVMLKRLWRLVVLVFMVFVVSFLIFSLLNTYT